MDMNLSGKHALVCGASHGIGAAIALELAQMGASLTLLARSEDSLAQVKAEISGETGVDAQLLPLDLDDTDALQKSIADHFNAHPTHIIINNTGGPPGGPLIQADANAFIQAFQRHLVAAQTILQAALPGMRAADYGRVINIVSTSVREPIPGLGVSNTIRAAVAGWAKTLAHELGPDQICINNVLPGFTQTRRLDAIIENRAAKSGQDIHEVATNMRSQVPFGRFAEPKEVAAMAAFLATPAAAYVTGQSIAVDGGRMRSI